MRRQYSAGRCRSDISGKPFGPKPLRISIARLAGRHILALGENHLFDLPLIYGLNYDRCQLDYRVTYGHKVELTGLASPTSSDDWPYANFPPPSCLMCRCGSTIRRAWRAMRRLPRAFPTCPGVLVAGLIVAVPPPAAVGVSLWGAGDADDTTIVFECDLKRKTVSARNLTN